MIPTDDVLAPFDELAGIDPQDLAVTVRVLQQLHHLPDDHPDIRTVKHAASHMYKALKRERRTRKREAELAADRAVTEATATGSPMRIDDETQGIPLVSTVQGAFAGELINPRGCYICKNDYTLVDAFYHWLCPSCAAFSHGKRDQRADLTGKRALLTGGRAKIGMYIALRLLRDGAHTTITTRFPKDAVRRFAALEDSADWIHRLKIVGIDLRDPTQVVSLADEVAAAGPLDILINNAAQTVRRSPGAYSQLVELESAPLPDDVALPEMVTFDRISDAHPAAIAGTLQRHAVAHHEGESVEAGPVGGGDDRARPLRRQREPRGAPGRDRGRRRRAAARPADRELLDPEGRGGRPPRAARGPALQRDRPVHPDLAAAPGDARRGAGRRPARVRRERVRDGGPVLPHLQGPGHPHTNMAKAALNMLTRTSAGEMFETDAILMTAVDTGWITDERPHQEKLRIAAEGWHAPLDLVDGAARVYDPIVLGEAGEDLYGCFVKDFRPSPW